MKSKILIIGSTGKLGTSLINYCTKEKLNVFAITGYTNFKKLKSQSKKLNTKNFFSLSEFSQKNKFFKFLERHSFKVVYFLDYGSYSLSYLNIILSHNKNTYIAIANKEMIIAGGLFLIKKIYKTSNYLIPLDSEHFSLQNSNFNYKDIKKIYITASGGPFYFNKRTNLENVSIKSVLKHPKWDMGFNNSIDSSNFINKILEMFELSSIYNIGLDKIDFLVSKEAFVHSIITYEDNTISINCFDNNMLIPLIKPLTTVFNSKNLKINNLKILNQNNFKLEQFRDTRFKIISYLNKFKKLNHSQQIKLMILNNKAHKLYLNNAIEYSEIIEFIIKNLFIEKKIVKFKSFNDILKYIKILELKYEINI